MTATVRLTTLRLKTGERPAAPRLSGGRGCSLAPGALSAPSDGGNSNLQLGDGTTSPYTMKLYRSPHGGGRGADKPVGPEVPLDGERAASESWGYESSALEAIGVTVVAPDAIVQHATLGVELTAIYSFLRGERERLT